MLFRIQYSRLVPLIACTLLLPLGTSEAEEFSGQRWAVLVGVDDYAQAADLQFCGADVAALRDRLVAAGFPDKQIKLLHDKADENRFRPFKANIERQLELVLTLAERGDMVFVALSGHGVHFDGASYFCPAEADLENRATLVSLDGIYAKLKSSQASLKFVVVDACRNDPRVSGQKSLSTPAKDFARSLQQPVPEGMILLSSCAPGETSYEEPKFGHGVFMYHMLEGLKGKADSDGDQRVSVDELRRYAGRQTKVYVADAFNDSQRPYLRGELTSDALDFGFSTPAALAPGTVANSIGMHLKLIEPGSFLMGSPVSDVDASDDEKPQHRRSITKPYYLQTTEVTQGQWLSVMRSRPWQGKFGVKEGPNYPAAYIDWDAAVSFCSRLSAKEHQEYRLPTEAEWEFACRAGTTTKYSFGSDLRNLRDHAWFDANSYDVGEAYAHEVGLKKPNAWGIHDMHGNVSEWCSDIYQKTRIGCIAQADLIRFSIRHPAFACYAGGRGATYRSILVPQTAIHEIVIVAMERLVFASFVSLSSRFLVSPGSGSGAIAN